MGFLIKVDEDKGEVTVTLGDKIVSTFTGMGSIKEGLESQLEWSGGDYLEPHAERMLVNKKHLRTAKRANNLEEAGKTLHEDELEGEKDVKESKSQNEYDIKSSDDGDGTTNIWTLIADDGPLKDAHVNVLWSAYFDDTIEKFTEHFQVQMWAWENTPGGDYDMWVSRLEAMKKSAKVPITNIVALGLGSLHESNPDACCGDIPRFIEGERTFISSGPSVQLAIVMKMREVLGDNGKLLPCVIQDPVYSKLDKRFLRSLDFTVVDDPDAFELINANSLVFAMGMYPRIMWWICDGVWPAAIVTEKGYDDVANVFTDMMHGAPTYVAPGLRDMFQDYIVDDLFSEKFLHKPGITRLYLRK